MKYTYIEESPYNKNRYMVKFKIEDMPGTRFRGSLNVFGARIFGLNYVDYLKMLRDKYNAEIVGKHCFYPVPYFKNQADAMKVQTILEARFREILD